MNISFLETGLTGVTGVERHALPPNKCCRCHSYSTMCRHVEKIQSLTGLLFLNCDCTIVVQGTGLANGQLLADKRSNLITSSFHHFHGTLFVCEQHEPAAY